MTSPEPDAGSIPKVVFRPGKKRKAYRQRAKDGDISDVAAVADKDGVIAPIPAAAAISNTTPSPPEADENEEGLSVSEALRLRNARKHRLGGVGFRAGLGSHADDAENALIVGDGTDPAAQEDSTIIGGVEERFAPQTGMVGELVNRHMEEYIESELARRKRLAAEIRAQHDLNNKNNTITSALQIDPTTGSGAPVESQRALHGKLMEIDLGEEARARNIAMTEKARRRLEGQAVEDEEEGDSRAKKMRLGRDGKPWRPRNRRGSEDIERDRRVEEFLRENRLGVYDVPSEQPEIIPGLTDENGAADDRIAEEFRREFMDAMSQRHRRRRPAVNATSKPAARNQDEILKGPKLGGSRNARAAMRDKLLSEQQQKKR